jgi:hypothetical protein
MFFKNVGVGPAQFRGDSIEHMSSLCIPFSEGDKVILLRGSHISVGRFPDNTIQIEDRTVSAYHFELVFERDHYRLHDRGSTNGVMINGRRVQDFHLREETQILVGTVLCNFHPSNPMNARSESVELLPVREEVQATRRECRQLKEQNSILREQIARMLAERGGGPTAFDQLADANARLRLEVVAHREEVECLASRLTVLARDRDNLQRAYNDLKIVMGMAGSEAVLSRSHGSLNPAVTLMSEGEVGSRSLNLARRMKEAPPGDDETQRLDP